MLQIKQFSFLLLCISMSFLLMACGSKGDLYQAEEKETLNETMIQATNKGNEEPKKKQP